MKWIWFVACLIVIIGLFYFIAKFYGYFPDLLGLFRVPFF